MSPSEERAAVEDGSTESVVGRIGRVIIRIPGTARAGEISVPIRGGTEAFLAYSDEEIALGASVLVVASRGGRSVDVAWYSG